MKIYVSRKDETIKAKLLEYNEKFNTYMMEFITGDRKGKTTSFSASTMKRWWKVVDDSEEVITKEVVKKAKTTKSTDDILDMVEEILKNLSIEFKRSSRCINVYSNGVKLASIYRRVARVRIYMKVSLFTKLDVDSAIFKSSIINDEINFYIDEDNIDFLLENLNTISKECKH